MLVSISVLPQQQIQTHMDREIGINLYVLIFLVDKLIVKALIEVMRMLVVFLFHPLLTVTAYLGHF